MKKVNPFNPGFGLAPPLLAGREDEQRRLTDKLAELTVKPHGSAMMLYGPRGMGKTVLLGWFKDICQHYADEDSSEVSVIGTAAPKMLQSEESALDVLLPADTVVSEIEGSAKGQVLGVASVGGTAKIQMRQRSWGNIEKNLIAVCKQTPTVLLVDEAHAIGKIDIRLYQQFLNVAQEVMTKAPFMLLLAGTPGLPDALAATQATFITRTEAMGIGRLNLDTAAAAIRDPLQSDGYTIDDDALSFAVEDSQCYPYFLQCWGHQLWDIAHAHEAASGKKHSPILSRSDAEQAAAQVELQKTQQYEIRYKEVSKDDRLKAVIGAVAEAFGEAEAIDSGRVQAIVKRALQPLAIPGDQSAVSSETLDRLRHLDYVWQPPGHSTMVPGIPSMMDYTRFKVQQE